MAGTCFVDHAGLELMEIYLSLPLLSTRIKACPTSAGRRSDSYEFCFSSDLGKTLVVAVGTRSPPEEGFGDLVILSSF